MQELSRKNVLLVTALLALWMLLTRHGHFMPDASMAIFFLGGLFVRRHLAFLGLLVLSVLIDWAAISLAGVSDFCVTAAYAFLPLAYAVLWYGAKGCGAMLARQKSLPRLAGLGVAAFVLASASFLVSNGAFYWLGGRVAEPTMGGWLANAWQWGPLFVGTTLAWLALPLVAQAVVGMLADRGHTEEG